MATLSQAVVWMNNNPVLVGWVQAAGALVALFIVIGFPIWQRGNRVRQARIAKLSLDVTLAQSVLLILTDAKSWIDYVLWTRGHKTDDVTEVIDSAELISRLLVCEKRESNWERLNALYLAHDAIRRAQRTLVLPSPADNSSADCHGSLLRDDQAVLERQWSIVDAQLSQALFRLQFAKCPFYMRPFLWWTNKAN